MVVCIQASMAESGMYQVMMMMMIQYRERSNGDDDDTI